MAFLFEGFTMFGVQTKFLSFSKVHDCPCRAAKSFL